MEFAENWRKEVNIETELRSMLVDHGLSEDMAERVVEAVKADPANATMKDRWNDNRDDYPAPIFAICWMMAKREALKMVDAECPYHWARGIFAQP